MHVNEMHILESAANPDRRASYRTRAAHMLCKEGYRAASGTTISVQQAAIHKGDRQNVAIRTRDALLSAGTGDPWYAWSVLLALNSHLF